MKKTSIFSIPLFLSLIINFVAYAQPDKNTQELIKYIEDSRQLFEVPGIAVAIIKDGEVQLNQGFGFRNALTNEAVDTKTMFGIASCSKAFTAACMAILVEEGKVKWEDRVVDHYPAFALNDPYITNEMRIQDLLCHRSGLQTFDGDLLWYGTNYSSEEVVERIKQRDISYSFRSQFGYQNVMFIAAGEVIKNVTGKTWDEYLTEKIFLPLSMNRSNTSNQEFDKSMNVALPHIDGKPLEFINYDNSGPAASINTCSDDLLNWVSMLLSKGSFNDKQIFSDMAYYKLTSPLTIINSRSAEKVGGTHFNTYGLGWFMFDFEGRKVIQHGGGLPGFHSKVVLVPEENLAYIIIANQISGLVESLYKKILDYYLSDGQEDWAKKYRDYEISKKEREKTKEKEKEDARDIDTAPSYEMNEQIGLYEDNMYGQATVELKGDQLYVTLLPTKTLFHSIMDHWEKDTYKITFNDPFLPSGYVNFYSEENKKVSGFTIDLKNPDFHFYKLDFKKID